MPDHRDWPCRLCEKLRRMLRTICGLPVTPTAPAPPPAAEVEQAAQRYDQANAAVLEGLEAIKKEAFPLEALLTRIAGKPVKLGK